MKINPGMKMNVGVYNWMHKETYIEWIIHTQKYVFQNYQIELNDKYD